jgi:hypothetical protein
MVNAINAFLLLVKWSISLMIFSSMKRKVSKKDKLVLISNVGLIL